MYNFRNLQMIVKNLYILLFCYANISIQRTFNTNSQLMIHSLKYSIAEIPVRILILFKNINDYK